MIRERCQSVLRMIAFILTFGLLIVNSNAIFAQPVPVAEIFPPIQFLKEYGNDQDQSSLWDARQTQDGGYIAVGLTRIISVNQWDGWIMKLSNNGSIQWQRYFQTFVNTTTYYDRFLQVVETSSRDYIVLGTDGSSNDPWLLKLDSAGNLIAHKSIRAGFFSGNGLNLTSLHSTNDGNIIIGGYVSSLSQSLDPVAIKMDPNLNIIWERRYEAAQPQRFHQVIPTSDGGYIGVGYYDPDFDQALFVKLSSTGTIQWQRAIDSPEAITNFEWNSAGEGVNGDLILVGHIWEATFPTPTITALAARVDNQGVLQWIRSYDINSGNTKFLDVVRTPDGFNVATGYAGDDMLLVKFNDSGNIVWQTSYHIATGDAAVSLRPTSDGAFVAAGFMRRNDNNGLIWKCEFNGNAGNNCSAQRTINLVTATPTNVPVTMSMTLQSNALVESAPNVRQGTMTAGETLHCQGP